MMTTPACWRTESGLLTASGKWNLTMRYTTYLWTVPFIAFLGGYFLADYFLRIERVITPSLVGLRIHQAFELLADKHLYPRLLEEKLDADLPPGTVLNQIPAAETPVRPGQTVLLVISQQPQRLRTPHFIGSPKATIERETATLGIKTRLYTLSSLYPAGTCIGQWPSPDTQLDEPKMIIYLSSGNEKPSIVPDLRGISFQEAHDFCLQHGLIISGVRKYPDNGQPNANDLVIDQRPLPGSLLHPSIMNIQLQVSKTP